MAEKLLTGMLSLNTNKQKFWSEKVGGFAIHLDKARPYFKKYQEHKLSFCRCGCEFLSDSIDLYFWGNHNDTKL